MALSAEVRKDAERYNAEYDLFEAVRQGDGYFRHYRKYGVAYAAVGARVRRGENWRLYGLRYDEGMLDALTGTRGGFRRVELAAC